MLSVHREIIWCGRSGLARRDIVTVTAAKFQVLRIALEKKRSGRIASSRSRADRSAHSSQITVFVDALLRWTLDFIPSPFVRANVRETAFRIFLYLRNGKD